MSVDRRLLARFAPPLGEPAPQPTPAQIDLGHMLFFDPRLSADHTISCNSCHSLTEYGVDGLATSVGADGQHGTRNAPTVYNAALHFAQFWDGRADTIEDQATGPMLNPVEMAATEERILETLASMPGYRSAFASAFPDELGPITLDKVGRALGAYERTLVTTSAWDDYLAGDDHALDAHQKRGLLTFITVGCVSCHTGPEVGASMFQKTGAVVPWPKQGDPGRMAVTGREVDRMLFKVPTMKNVTRTAPYFHDGSAETLDEAVRLMGRHQLGLELTDEEVADMLVWMEALTGELPHERITAPELPASTGRTPAPQTQPLDGQQR